MGHARHILQDFATQITSLSAPSLATPTIVCFHGNMLAYLLSYPEVHFKVLIWLVKISMYPGLTLTLALPLTRNKSENESCADQSDSSFEMNFGTILSPHTVCTAVLLNLSVVAINLHLLTTIYHQHAVCAQGGEFKKDKSRFCRHTSMQNPYTS